MASDSATTSATVTRSPLVGERFRISRCIDPLDMAAWLLEGLGAAVSRTAAADAHLGTGAAHQLNVSVYGPRGRFASAPAHDSAVEAIGGALNAQWTYARRPAYLVTPFATVAHALT